MREMGMGMGMGMGMEWCRVCGRVICMYVALLFLLDGVHSFIHSCLGMPEGAFSLVFFFSWLGYFDAYF